MLLFQLLLVPFLSELEIEDIQKKINVILLEFQGFKSIILFWSHLKQRESHFNGGYFPIKFTPENLEYYNELMNLYKSIITFLKNDSFGDISLLNIKPAKRLSSGEKSILDFFSSLHSSIEWILIENHYRDENFILLLL